MKILTVALALLSQAAMATVIGVVQAPDGATIALHDVAGPCVRGALLAEYRTIAGETIPGCYQVVGPLLAVSWLDGDAGRIPVAVVRKPLSS